MTSSCRAAPRRVTFWSVVLRKLDCVISQPVMIVAVMLRLFTLLEIYRSSKFFLMTSSLVSVGAYKAMRMRALVLNIISNGACLAHDES